MRGRRIDGKSFGQAAVMLCVAGVRVRGSTVSNLRLAT
jgi:hypothetical protein